LHSFNFDTFSKKIKSDYPTTSWRFL